MATGTRQRSSSVQKVVQQVSQLPLGQTNYSQADTLPDASAKDGGPAAGSASAKKPEHSSELKPWEEPSKGEHPLSSSWGLAVDPDPRPQASWTTC